MTPEECKQAELNLNPPKELDLEQSEIGLLKGKSVSRDLDGKSLIKYKVSPKVKVGPLLKGDLLNAFGSTSLSLEFTKEYQNDDVEVVIKVNGDIKSLLNSPAGTGKFGASFGATKKF